MEDQLPEVLVDVEVACKLVDAAELDLDDSDFVSDNFSFCCTSKKASARAVVAEATVTLMRH
eukprot:7122271-Ditylum_brightwellii.AAC.1